MNSMKKSVRIRKALPGETPRFINKTSKFLTKAKMGMSVSAPSSDEMIKNIVETIYTDLSYDADPDIVLSETVSKYKISEQSALMLLKIAMTRLSDEGFYDKEDIKSDAEKTEDKEKALAIANQKNKELQKQQTESDNAELDEMNFSEEGYDAEEEEERLNDRSHLEDEESMQQEAFDDGGEISEQQQIINQYAYPGKKNDKIFSLDEEIKNTPGTVPIIPGMYPELTDYIANYRPISDSFEYSKYLPEGKEGMSMETFDPACPCPPTCDCRDYGLAVKEGIPLLTKFFPEAGASLARGLQGFDFINKETPIGSSTGIQRVLPLGSLAGQGVRAIPKVGKWFDPKAPQTYIVQNRLDMFKLLGGQDVTDLPSFLRNGNAIDPNSVSVKSLELLGSDIDKILKYVDAAGGATAQTNSFMLKDVDPNIDLGITNTIGGIYDGNTKIVFGLDDVSKTPFFQLERQVTPGERLVDGIVPKKASPVTFKNRFYFETMGPRQSMAIYNSNGELILNRGEKSLFSTVEPNYFTGQTQYFPSTQKPLTKEDMTFGRRLTDHLLFPRPYFRSGTLQEQVFPTLGYTAPGQQQEGFNPASLTADEILKDWQYQKNYNKRLGYKTLGYPLGLGALGYGIYKSIYPDPCPCANGTMKVECCEEKDPTTQTVGTSNEIRNVDPSTLNKTVIPDSIKRLQDNPNTRLENVTDREYYEMMKKMRLRPDSINPKVPYRIGVEDIPGKEEKYGGATKNQFIKKVGGLLRKDEGGENTLGKGSRQDTLTSDVSQIKTDFIKSVNKKAGDALLSNIYEKANKTGDQGLINALMGNQEAPQARRGMAINNDDVPEWYTGYNYMLKPRQYRKYFNKLKKLLPKGLDISKLNYASSMYNSNLSRAPFGNVFTIDDYAKLLTSAAYPIKEGMEMQGPSMYVQDTDIFGRPKRYMVDFSGRMSAQRQAEQVEETNNKKNIDALSLPIILQNPGYDGIMPPSQTGIDFTNDKSVFLNWSQTPTQPQGLPGPEAYYNQGGFVDMDVENPLTKFGYGGDETDYYEPYSLPEANGGLSVSGQKCPPGYGFSKSQNKCVPFKPKRTYVPVTIPNRRDYGFRGILPWNPIFSNAGSWSKQMRLPYYLNNNQLYTGQLPSSPMARYVTDTDIFGRDKRYIDIYDVGEGDNLSDLYDFVGSQNMNTQNNNRQQTRQKVSGDRLDRRIARWDRRAARNEEEYEPMEGVIRNYENPDDFYNAINPIYREDAQFLGAGYTAAEDYKNKGKVRKVRDAEGNWYDRNDKMIPDKKAPSEVPGYYDPVKKHGGLHKYAPGGINDPSPGGYNPFALGTGFGMGFGQSTSAYDPQSADARFERELQGGAGPSKLPPQQQNPFAFITGTGTGSYAETANTGHTLGSQGQEIIPQKVSPNNKRNLVGVESKRKIMREVNPQGMVDVKNNMIISPITMAIENRGRKQNEINTTLDFTSANMNYPAANEIYQGKDVDYGSGIGMFTPEQGSDRSSYSTFGRYGGYMAYGGFADPYFEEDEEVYMTPEELEQFLAAGGQVEYL